MNPELAMQEALVQAGRVQGRTFPNPVVGAVVFRGGEVLGRGGTRPPGGPHAEIVALRAARRRAGARGLRGASMAVTLEPCCHQGRTGPCTEALIEAGLARVFVGCRDPHPAVAGRGLRRLRRAGVETHLDVLGAECRDHHRAFLSVWKRGRPWVALKLATSLDGRIATAAGESQWITGPAARRLVHTLREHVDGVLVGSGTALADDPELSARRGSRVVHRPVRVLVDSKLRVPADAKLYRRHRAGRGAGEARTWVLCARGARGRAAREARGARLFETRRLASGLDLRSGLATLGAAGLTSLLVEGGGRLAAALLRAELVDEIHWFQAPLLLGGDARPALGALGVRHLEEALRLEKLAVERVGPDLYLKGRLRGKRG